MMDIFFQFYRRPVKYKSNKNKIHGPMKTDQLTQPTAAGFPQIVSNAVARLKQRLQQDYEQAYPDLREIMHLVLDQEETNAWELSPFPHLLLPDLVEAHVAKLNLRPAKTRHENIFAPDDFAQTDNCEPAFALCA
jgi:hypothetical protein